MQLLPTQSVVNGVCKIKGPQVPFLLTDTGQANVMVHVAISDGTHMNFPSGGGGQGSGSTVLPPGKYLVTVMVVAFCDAAFGRSYDSSVSLGGKQVVTASGSVPADFTREDGSFVFKLTVS